MLPVIEKMKLISMDEALKCYAEGKEVKVVYTASDWENSVCSTLQKELKWLLERMVFLLDDDGKDADMVGSNHAVSAEQRVKAKEEISKAVEACEKVIEPEPEHEMTPEEKLLADIEALEGIAGKPVGAKPIEKKPIEKKHTGGRTGGRQRKDFDYDRAAEMRANGSTYQTIADEFGCSDQTVINRLRGKKLC